MNIFNFIKNMIFGFKDFRDFKRLEKTYNRRF